MQAKANFEDTDIKMFFLFRATLNEDYFYIFVFVLSFIVRLLGSPFAFLWSFVRKCRNRRGSPTLHNFLVHQIGPALSNLSRSPPNLLPIQLTVTRETSLVEIYLIDAIKHDQSQPVSECSIRCYLVRARSNFRPHLTIMSDFLSINQRNVAMV
jgi:hypothetical protein